MKKIFFFYVLILFAISVEANEVEHFACECAESKRQLIPSSDYFEEVNCNDNWILSEDVNFNKINVKIYFDDEQKNIGNNWVMLKGTNYCEPCALHNYKKTQTDLYFSFSDYISYEGQRTAINLNYTLNRFNLNSDLTISIIPKNPNNPSLDKIDFEKGLKTLVNKYSCTKDKIF